MYIVPTLITSLGLQWSYKYLIKLPEVRKIQPCSCSTKISISASLSVFQTNSKHITATRRITNGNQTTEMPSLSSAVLWHLLPDWMCAGATPQPCAKISSPCAVSTMTSLSNSKGVHVQTESTRCSTAITSGVWFLFCMHNSKNHNIVSTVSTSWLI